MAKFPGPTALPWMAALALAALAGCADDDSISGERIPVREIASQTQEIDPGPPSPLPPVVSNENWPQRDGNAAGGGFHPAHAGGFEVAWRYRTGSGANSEWPHIAPPAVADGVVVVLDPSFVVHAVGAEQGRELWRAELVPDGESASDAVGGGVAIADGNVYVATGFGEVASLGLDDGSLRWRSRTSAPVHASPLAVGARVATVARDDIVRVFDSGTGEELWSARGAGAPAVFLQSSSPAARDGIVAVPYGSGEVAAYQLENGTELWRALLAGDARDAPVAAFADVTAGPTIVGDKVFAGTRRGEFAAMDWRTGDKAWTRTIGAGTGGWVLGDSVYVVDGSASLLRLSVANGGGFWRLTLPAFEDPDDSEDPIHYASPVVAGGRVLVGASDGVLHVVDAATGAPVDRLSLGPALPAGAAVAGGTVFLFDGDGVLRALR